MLPYVTPVALCGNITPCAKVSSPQLIFLSRGNNNKQNVSIVRLCVEAEMHQGNQSKMRQELCLAPEPCKKLPALRSRRPSSACTLWPLGLCTSSWKPSLCSPLSISNRWTFTRYFEYTENVNSNMKKKGRQNRREEELEGEGKYIFLELCLWTAFDLFVITSN